MSKTKKRFSTEAELGKSPTHQNLSRFEYKLYQRFQTRVETRRVGRSGTINRTSKVNKNGRVGRANRSRQVSRTARSGKVGRAS